MAVSTEAGAVGMCILVIGCRGKKVENLFVGLSQGNLVEEAQEANVSSETGGGEVKVEKSNSGINIDISNKRVTDAIQGEK